MVVIFPKAHGAEKRVEKDQRPVLIAFNYHKSKRLYTERGCNTYLPLVCNGIGES